MKDPRTVPFLELDLCPDCEEFFNDELDPTAGRCPGCQMIRDLDLGLESSPDQTEGGDDERPNW